MALDARQVATKRPHTHRYAWWKRSERLCEWKRPQAPSVRGMFQDQRATPAVLTFLRDTKIGRMVSVTPRWDEWGRTAKERRPGRARPRMYFPFVSFLCFLFPLFDFFLADEGKGKGTLL